MSSISHECDKNGCFYCYETERLRKVNDPNYKTVKLKKVKSKYYFNRLLKTAG